MDILAFKYPIGFKYPAAFIFDFVDAYGPKMTLHRFLKLTLANPGKQCLFKFVNTKESTNLSCSPKKAKKGKKVSKTGSKHYKYI